MFAPLESETFTNNAAEIGGTYKADGNIDGQYARRANITFSYNAPNSTYTVSGGGVSQQFNSSHIEEEDSASILYLRTSGKRTDTLLLTKPGNSGPLTYRYVGAGFWQRTEDNLTSADIDIRAFTYGVETPAASVPNSGKANYEIDVLALGGYEQYVGQGGAAVDFASDQLLISAPLRTVLLDGTVSEDGLVFSGSGTIGSGNSFAGSFSISPHLVTNGTIEGMFYGPNAQELGASFFSEGIAGTIIGREGSGSGLASTTATITNQGLYSYYLYEENDGAGTVVSFRNVGYNFNTLTYNGAAKTFLFDSPAWAGTFGLSDKISSDARFDVYRRGDGTKLSIFKSSSSNPDIALTYLSFAFIERSPSAGGGTTAYEFAYKDWGLRTASRPLSGTANYGAKIYGIASGDTRIYNLTGQANFVMNFGAATWTGTMSPVGTPQGSGAAYSFAPLSAGGSISLGNEFQGTAGSNMQIYGNFYGPAASELGATFSGYLGVDGAGESISASGAIVGALK